MITYSYKGKYELVEELQSLGTIVRTNDTRNAIPYSFYLKVHCCEEIAARSSEPREGDETTRGQIVFARD